MKYIIARIHRIVDINFIAFFRFYESQEVDWVSKARSVLKLTIPLDLLTIPPST